jgi:His/Glu/Gln/Arg/opine family amino acid ABC transporter permease subunit
MFDVAFYARWTPYVLEGLALTLAVSFAAALIGIGFGLVLALLRLTRRLPALSWFATIFIEYVRGVPALVVLFFTYYALPHAGIQLNALWAAAVGLGINESVFAAEIFRAGIQSLPRGQIEAGRAIGLSTWDLYRFIVLPQAITWLIPPLTNDLIGLIKNSSLASTITVNELTLRSLNVVSATFRPFEGYFILASTYVGLVLVMSGLSHRLERRMRFTT